MLTMKELEQFEEGIFATGILRDNELGLHLAGSGEELRWIGVKGAENAWCIYAHISEYNQEWIREFGFRVIFESNIKRCIPCDKEAFAHYRHCGISTKEEEKVDWYKVITKGSRTSSNDRLDAHHKRRRYIKRYRKGKVVNAVPRSAGLFIFKHKKDAELFMSYHPFGKYFKIIKVKPLQPPTECYLRISTSCTTTNIKRFYAGKASKVRQALIGTYTCNSLIPLE